jgi:hypothetical protein
MKQPMLPNRKPTEFVRCPVCGADFWRTSSRQRRVKQLWCSRNCAQAASRQGRGAASERPIAEKSRP